LSISTRSDGSMDMGLVMRHQGQRGERKNQCSSKAKSLDPQRGSPPKFQCIFVNLRDFVESCKWEGLIHEIHDIRDSLHNASDRYVFHYSFDHKSNY
jgi:hypothetical protein